MSKSKSIYEGLKEKVIKKLEFSYGEKQSRKALSKKCKLMEKELRELSKKLGESSENYEEDLKINARIQRCRWILNKIDNYPLEKLYEKYNENLNILANKGQKSRGVDTANEKLEELADYFKRANAGHNQYDDDIESTAESATDSLNSIPSSEDNYNLNLEPEGNKGKQAEDIFTVEDINEKVNEARNKEGYVNNDEIKVIEREESISSQSDEQKSGSEITVENKKYLVENLPGVALRTYEKKIIREKPIEKKVTIRNPRISSLNWQEQYPQYSSVNNSPIMKSTADKGKSPSINHSPSLNR